MESVYNPLIGCAACKKDTRHMFVRLERRTYQCVEERRKVSVLERERMEKSSALDSLIHKCVVCGTERGYGNREV